MSNFKVIIIFGQSEQCRKTCKKLSAQGHTVIIVAPDNDMVGTIRKECVDGDGGCMAFPGIDVQSMASVTAVMESVQAKYPNIDSFLHFSGAGLGTLPGDVQDYMGDIVDSLNGATSTTVRHEYISKKDGATRGDFVKDDREFADVLADRVGGKDEYEFGENQLLLREKEGGLDI